MAEARHRRKLIVLLVNTDPRNGHELGAPFYHAAVAAAMDYDVDLICTAAAGRLMGDTRCGRHILGRERRTDGRR